MCNKKLITFAIVLSSAMASVGFAVPQNQPTHTVSKKKLHGEGRKALSCPMQSLKIINAAGDEIADINYADLLTLKARDIAYSDDRRMKKENLPTLPLARLIQNYQFKGDVSVFSCDDQQGIIFTADEIMNDEKRLLLTLNNAGRLRLAEFNYERRRYGTKVKNLVRIEIIAQP